MTSSAKKLAGATSLTASMTIARWSRVDPLRCASSSFLCVCSTTTIAASTSSPIAIAMPPSDMMFADIPNARNGMNATSTATGMVMSGMSALGRCLRKSSTTNATVSTTSTSVSLTLSIARRISAERS